MPISLFWWPVDGAGHLSQTFATELARTSFLVVCTAGTMGRHR